MNSLSISLYSAVFFSFQYQIVLSSLLTLLERKETRHECLSRRIKIILLFTKSIWLTAALRLPKHLTFQIGSHLTFHSCVKNIRTIVTSENLFQQSYFWSFHPLILAWWSICCTKAQKLHQEEAFFFSSGNFCTLKSCIYYISNHLKPHGMIVIAESRVTMFKSLFDASSLLDPVPD